MNRFLVIWLFGVIALFSFAFGFFEKLPDGRLHLYFLDVGQGDALLIQTRRGQFILVDSGPGTAVLSALSDLKIILPRIDAVIVTHFEKDHAEGFLQVMRSYEIGKIYIGGALRGSALEREFFVLAQQYNIPIRIVRSDRDLQIDDETFLDFLYPFFAEVRQRVSDSLNETSVTFRLLDKKKSLLFSGGDMGFPLEEKLLRRDSEQPGHLHLDAENLKVSHHGSRFSSGENFLQKVRPKIGVISVGKRNSYGHPHDETLSRLSGIGATIRRTDLEGTVEMAF